MWKKVKAEAKAGIHSILVLRASPREEAAVTLLKEKANK